MPAMWKRLSDFIFGEPVRNDLPARVVQQIEARQCVSERLISWVQFILILLFGSLWLVSQQVNIPARLLKWCPRPLLRISSLP
jgi:hypothetical protein